MATSLGNMVKKIEGLRCPKEINEWESQFIQSVVQRVKDNNGSTASLSAKQVEVVARIHDKHFA